MLGNAEGSKDAEQGSFGDEQMIRRARSLASIQDTDASAAVARGFGEPRRDVPTVKQKSVRLRTCRSAHAIRP